MNRWNRTVCILAAISTLAAVGTFTAKPLMAQIKAALVQDIDEPGRIPYQSIAVFSQGGGGCVGPNCFSCSGNLCSLNFAPVPSNKRLVVTSVLGEVYVDTPGVLQPIQLGRVFIPTVLQTGTFPGAGAGSDNIIGINAAASMLTPIDGGNIPTINMVSTTPFSASNGLTNGQMTITGYLVDCSAVGSCSAIVSR
jgi:hypothetical protein